MEVIKKTTKKNLQFFIFHLVYMDKKIFFKFEIGYILIFQMKPSEFKVSILTESYDEKTAENYLKKNA